MKTLIKTENNWSLYIFDDNEVLNIGDDQIAVGEPVTLYIGDCNSSNVTLFENVTPPDDWCGCKYLYTAENGWELNPNWVEPVLEDPE
jgi:hypothetical protein